MLLTDHISVHINFNSIILLHFTPFCYSIIIIIVGHKTTCVIMILCLSRHLELLVCFVMCVALLKSCGLLQFLFVVYVGEMKVL